MRFSTQTIRDAEARSAGALVCQALHGGRETEFSVDDIAEVRALAKIPGELEKRGISEHLLPALESQLAYLEAYVGSTRGQWEKLVDGEKDRPFCRAFKPEALYNPDMAACARALADAIGGGEHLSLGEFLKAGRLLDHVENGTEPKGYPDDPEKTAKRKEGFERFKAAAKAGVITRQRYNVLHGIFLSESVARGQFEHGPVSIGGRDFEHVFRLDRDATDISKMDADQVKAFILRRYEAEGKALNDCFYDRVYVRYKGELYLLLTESGGSVTKGKNKVPDDASVGMLENAREGDVGRVVHRQTAMNTKTKALLKVINDMKAMVTGDGPLAELLEAEERLKKGEASTDETSKLIKLIAATVGFTGLVSAFNIWGVVGILVVGVAATGRNGVDYLRAARDDFKLRPVYHAIGVGLATDDV